MLTASELADLTQRINARVVRVIHEEIQAWQREQSPATLGAQWPSMPDLDGGIDHFAEYPISGEPDEFDDAYEPDFDDDEDETTHKTSDARRARVAENQRKHRRRKMEYERKVEYVAVIKQPPTLSELVAFVQANAMAGMMPSKVTFDSVRPKSWATASEQTRRLGVAWSDIAYEAGLRMRPSRHTQEA